MKLEKFIPKCLDILTAIGGVILIYWIIWISSSNLQPNEFGDAINPLITSITLIILLVSYFSQKKELADNSQRVEKDEFQKIFFNLVELIKNARGRIEWRNYHGLESIIHAVLLLKGDSITRIHKKSGEIEKIYTGDDPTNYEINGFKKEIFLDATFIAYLQLIDYTYNYIEKSSVIFSEKEQKEYNDLLGVILAKSEVELYQKYKEFLKNK